MSQPWNHDHIAVVLPSLSQSTMTLFAVTVTVTIILLLLRSIVLCYFCCHNDMLSLLLLWLFCHGSPTLLQSCYYRRCPCCFRHGCISLLLFHCVWLRFVAVQTVFTIVWNHFWRITDASTITIAVILFLLFAVTVVKTQVSIVYCVVLLQLLLHLLLLSLPSSCSGSDGNSKCLGCSDCKENFQGPALEATFTPNLSVAVKKQKINKYRPNASCGPSA